MKSAVCAGIVLLVFATGAVAQPDSSIPVEAEFDVTGPVRVAGNVSLDARLAGVLLHAGEGSAFQATVRDASVRVVNVPYRLVATQHGSVVGSNWIYVWEEPELVWARSWTGTISLSEVGGPESTIRVLPADGGFEYALHDDELSLGPPTRFPTAGVEDHAALRGFSMHPVESKSVAPEGVYAPISVADASVDGATRLVLYGGGYLLEGATSVDVETGHALNSTAGDPLGQVGIWRYDRIVLLVEAPDAHVALERGTGHLDLLVRHLSGTLFGDVALHGVHGGLVADQEQVGAYGLAQVIGNLTVDARYGPSSTWGVAGEASFVALDAEPMFGSRIKGSGLGLPEAAAASLLVAAASAVAYIVRKGIAWRWVEAWKVKARLLAPLAARLDQARLLASRPRRAILRFLKNRGMLPEHVVLKAMAPSLEMSESSVRKHLAKLDDGGQLATVDQGRRKFVGPNHGVLGSREVQVGLALASPDVGEAIAMAVCTRPGINQQSMVRSVRETTGRELSRAAIAKRADEFVEFPDTGGYPRSKTVKATPRRITLVRKERVGRLVLYWPTRALRQAMAAKARFVPPPKGNS